MKGFSTNAAAVLEFSRLIASELGHTYIGSEHLLLALLSENDVKGVLTRVFGHFKITYTDILSRVISLFGRGERTQLSSEDITPRLSVIIERSADFATRYAQKKISAEHLALSLLSSSDSVAVKILELSGVKSGKIKNLLISVMENEEKLVLEEEHPCTRREKFNEMRKQTPVLNKYGRDLVCDAFDGKGETLVGREKESERVIRVLLRRGKNNPCLIGEAGVGKSAVAEGIAKRIAEGRVPSALKDVRIVSLDISSVVAGAKYRGDFEERIRAIIDEVTNAGNVVLMIDEIHNIVGAGSAEGAIDAANILKPALARDSVRIIGATTLREYKKYIERDPALERRFQPIEIREPSVEEALEILRGIKSNYETFHSVEISDDAIVSAVNLSVRYITDRFLPDKAIDLIDEVCAKNKMEKKRRVEKEDIEQAVTEQTGIPLGKVRGEEGETLIGLSDKLKAEIVGQDKAVDTLVSSYIRSRIGLADATRPRAVYLFVGPTGVGKTELARAFSREIFDADSFIKIDMSEYSERHTVSKLIGAPAGYVGYEDGNTVFEKIRRRPWSVVVFDEIEKAHPDVLNLLLQIMDEGQINDAQGRRINFKNSVIILTSNIGSRDNSLARVGFGEEDKGDVKAVSKVRATLSPELISRIDEIIAFSYLDKNAYEKICKKFIDKVKDRCAMKGISVEVEDCVTSKLVDKADKKSGARGIGSVVKREVEEKISRFILENSSGEKNLFVTLDENGDVIVKEAAHY